MFVIFSFLGWLWESVYCTVCRRKWANRGFLYGPVCPIYGFGCVAGYFTYNAIESGAYRMADIPRGLRREHDTRIPDLVGA